MSSPLLSYWIELEYSAKAAVLAMRFAKRLGLFPKVGDLKRETVKAKEYNKKHP